MKTITERELERLIGNVNFALGSPVAPYTKENGKYRPNPGCYHLAIESGCYSLHVMRASCRVDLALSGSSKRNLHDQIHAFLGGITAVKKA